MSASVDDLLAQARRIRFSDTAMEARYNEERFASAMVRERVTMLACALVAGVIGVLEAFGGSDLYRHEGVMMTGHVVRFYLVIPLWIGLAVATFWRGFPRWADAANGVVTVLSCWGFSYHVWSLVRAIPERHLANSLTGTTILVLVVAVLMLPMRFRTLVATVAFALGGTFLFFQFNLGGDPAQARNLNNALSALSLVSLLVVLGGWFREAGERRLFAQREHARRLAEELAAANGELARLNAEKNEFMAIAAHDLRAPLATVRGFAELLRDGRASEPAKQAAALHEIHAQATRMLDLITDYLGVHAAESALLPVRRERLDLAALARAACTRHEPAAGAKGQALAGPDGDARLWVQADPGLLAQVIDNFVSNALKFTPRGGAISICVEGSVDGAVGRLAVRDSGPGIPVDEQPTLFRKFGRTSTRPTGGETSHGLGLAVAKRLTLAMGGRVGCVSEPGKGATFWVEMPLCQPG